MRNILIAEDSLYEDLYDVQREAEESGNLVEGDMNPRHVRAARQSARAQGLSPRAAWPASPPSSFDGARASGLHMFFLEGL